MSHSRELSSGERFEFGANWRQFLSTLNEDRIREAEKSLLNMLEIESLEGLSFLDAGSGSGLFSLAAKRLGANVHSFDFDPKSVACTRELRERFFPNDPLWRIDEASVLDPDYLKGLGEFDVVYSWGVLHHTGAMHDALANVIIPLKSDGKLYIAIYNDQGIRSRMWHRVKQVYCSGKIGRGLVKAVFLPYFSLRAIAIGMIRHFHPLGYFRAYKRQRGMSVYHDWIDWLGGLPFEVAGVEEISGFYDQRGLTLEKVVRTKRLGCNQFVFRKS